MGDVDPEESVDSPGGQDWHAMVTFDCPGDSPYVPTGQAVQLSDFFRPGVELQVPFLHSSH